MQCSETATSRVDCSCQTKAGLCLGPGNDSPSTTTATSCPSAAILDCVEDSPPLRVAFRRFVAGAPRSDDGRSVVLFPRAGAITAVGPAGRVDARELPCAHRQLRYPRLVLACPAPLVM